MRAAIPAHSTGNGLLADLSIHPARMLQRGQELAKRERVARKCPSPETLEGLHADYRLLDFTHSEVCLYPPPAPHPFEPFLAAPKALVEQVQQRHGPIVPRSPIEVRLRFEEVQR